MLSIRTKYAANLLNNVRDLFQAYSVSRDSSIPLQMDCDNTDLLALAVILWWSIYIQWDHWYHYYIHA